MKHTTAVLALGVLVGASSAPASATITIATFSDPSNVSTSPLFSVTPSAITGSWTGNNLNLQVAANTSGTSFTTYSNLHFNLPSVTRSGLTAGSGLATFTDASNTVIFTVGWSSATIIEPLVLGGSYLSANNVTFGGTAVAALGTLTDQQFAFSFANPAPLAGAAGTTYTSSFTSSATPVPEPASLLGLGAAGALALARRRRS